MASGHLSGVDVWRLTRVYAEFWSEAKAQGAQIAMVDGNQRAFFREKWAQHIKLCSSIERVDELRV